ncbi:MAG: PPC domain-containing protein [Myxococcota bacterium]
MTKLRILSAILSAAFLLTLTACGPSEGEGNNDGSESCQTDQDCSGDRICSPDDVCIDRGGSCETIFDCNFGDYCAGDYCRPSACESSDDCVGEYICAGLDQSDTGECRAGCESDDDCEGTQVCSSATNTCEEPGCTPNDCGDFEVCSSEFDPPECRLDGSCDPDDNPEQTCNDYTAQVGDGIDRVCNGETNQCDEVPPCESDDDCTVTGEICFIRSDARNVCEEGCRSDEACGLGEVCGEDNKCVSGCSSDAQCETAEGENYVCDDQICKLSCSTREGCYELGPNPGEDDGYVCLGQICQRCSDQNDCFGGEVCDLTADEQSIDGEEPVDDDGFGLCRPAPDPCPEDDYGDNHDQSSPYIISGDTLDASGDAGANYCRRNTAGEWFSVGADDGEVIDITMTYAGDGNLDIALLNTDGTEIVASARPPTEELPDQGTERIVYGVDAPSGSQNFLIQVRGTVVNPKVDYELNVEVRDPVDCADDGFEPNNDRESAVDLPGGNAFHSDLEVCGDDPDFYTLPVQANQVVTIGLEAPVRLGDVDMYLLSPDGTTIASSATESNSEEIVYNTTAAQDLVLEVRLAEGVGRAVYDLAWEQEPNICLDQYDPNESCASSPVLSEGQYPDLSVCDTDTDFYAIDLDPLDQIRVVAEYDRSQAQGELQLNLFGPNEVCASVLAADEESDPNSAIQRLIIQGENGESHWTTQAGGRYYVRAGLFSGVQADYSVDIDIIDGPDCTDDRYDSSGNDNDSTASAVTLQKGDVVNNGSDSALLDLKICDQDEDWYAIELDPGDSLEWVVDHDSQYDLEAFLYDSDGTTELDSSTNSASPDSVTTSVSSSATSSKTVYLKVEAKFTARAPYRLLTYVNGDGPTDAQCPDTFENNDDSSEATSLSTGSYSDLLSCSGDFDWYSTQVAAGETLTVTTDFDTADGDINLFLYADDASTELDRSSTRNAPEQVSYQSSSSQTLYYRVEASGSSASIPYSMDVGITAATACVDDRFAGNTDAASAEPVTVPGLYERLRKCESTSDWFAVDLTQDQEFEAFIRHDASVADLDLKLWREDPANPGDFVEEGSSSTTTDDESILYTPPADDTYYVEVLSKTTARNDYDLLLYKDVGGTQDVIDDGVDGPADRSCPDQFENNDTRPGEVAEIPSGTYGNLLICDNDVDFYSVFVPAGATLSVDLFFSTAENNIDAEVFRGTDTTPISGVGGRSTTDNESISVTNNQGVGENYVIEVYGRDQADAYYDMEVGLTFSDPCSEDSFGTAATPNFTQSDAASITAGSYELQLCEGTEDWYQFSLNNGEDVQAFIELQNRLGNIDIELYDAGGAQMASTTSSNTEEIDYTATVGGTYYLRVFPRDGVFMRNAYDLWLSVAGTAPTAPYCPDDFERNDDALSAANLDFSQEPQHTDMIMCSTEQDWYSVDLSSGLTYELKTFFDHSPDFDLAIEVRDSAGNPVQDDTTSTDISFANDTDDNDAIAEFTPSSDGVYTIGVEQQGTDASIQGGYYMYFDSTSAACPEDGYEPNNSSFDAVSIPSGVTELASCQANGNKNDFYTYTPTVDGDVLVEVLYDQTDLGLSGQVNSATMDDSTPNRLSYTVTGATAGTAIQIGIGNSSTTEEGPYFMRITEL